MCDAHSSTPMLTVMFSLKYKTMIDSEIIVNPRAAFIHGNDKDNAFDYFFRHWDVFMRIIMHNPTMCNRVINRFIGHGN